MTATRSLPLTGGAVTFAGAVSLDTRDGVQPWRIPVGDLELYEPMLRLRAVHPAGVRLTLLSDTSRLEVDVTCPPFGDEPAPEQWTFDLLVDGRRHQRITQPTDRPLLRFTDLPEAEHRLELYLYQGAPVRIHDVRIDRDADARPFDDPRPKWVAYGSSITQCVAAAGPGETWPAIVASEFDLNLTCLGYGGNCHLEPMVARMIRDLPADCISLCLGINVMGSGSLNPRTFRAAVIGLIQIIREKHPHTPMVAVSPICNPPRETVPNMAGMTLAAMRRDVAEAVELLRARGDMNLQYHDGLELFGSDFVHHMPDELHPDADGYRALARRYAQQVMPRLGLQIPAAV